MITRTVTRARRLVLAAGAAVCVLSLAGCSGSAVAESTGAGTGTGTPSADAKPSVKPKPSVTPLKTLDGARVNVTDGQTVGVGMPISVTFAKPVPAAERA